jgi:hypothetical protein
MADIIDYNPPEVVRSPLGSDRRAAIRRVAKLFRARKLNTVAIAQWFNISEAEAYNLLSARDVRERF